MRARFISAAVLGGLLFSGVISAQERFGGTGLVVGMHQDALTIIHVLTNTPAAKAGLSSGLVVQKIDGTPTRGKPLKDCVDILRGEPGSKVKLELVDTANHKTNTVELTREQIRIR
ncbi:MAG TPA: PDZ domain-containing protein [Candidatus Sulfotelmatobacter sp.]|nr:PDZ domain-containing protein [Candidatus Sulfotelmatobacter sp.]HWI56558.1 PDZ domain-containing protein [Bacillota bacterium]